MSNNHRPQNPRHYVPKDLVCHKEFLYVVREKSLYLPLLQLGLSDLQIWNHNHIHLLGKLHLPCSIYHQVDLEQWLLQPDLCFRIPYWTIPSHAWHQISIHGTGLNPSGYRMFPPILQMMISFLYLGPQTKQGPFLLGEGQMIAFKNIILLLDHILKPKS